MWNLVNLNENNQDYEGFGVQFVEIVSEMWFAPKLSQISMVCQYPCANISIFP